MSDAQEPYEVTLSNTQIVAWAALLVVLVVAAFAAGAWWGRSDAGNEPAEENAIVSLPTSSGLAPRSPEESAPAADVVNFFGDDTEDGAGNDASDSAADDAAEAPAEEPRTTEAALVVQVFSSTDLEQARGVEQKLLADEHPAFLSPQALDGEVMQRVRVGPYDSREAAEAAADQLAREYGLETWITPNN